MSRQRVLHMFGIMAAGLFLFSCLQGCRRPLWVAGSEYHSAVLITDWRQYDSSDPDGMTAWFYPENGSSRAYQYTVANVRRLEFYLPTGNYTGVVIDYSPGEFGKQEFVGTDYAETALVRSTPASYQPTESMELYGPECYSIPLGDLEETGFYKVSNQPETMALDTLKHMEVFGGEYGDYIPYKVRDTYQESFVEKPFYSFPICPIWKMRIRVYIKGLDYLWSTEGSLAGMADGRYLALNHTTDVPTLLSIPAWEVKRTGDNFGYIAATVSTFGLPDSFKPHHIVEAGEETKAEGGDGAGPVLVDWGGKTLLSPESVRLNLKFILRDQSTVLYYHFDVGEYVYSYDAELVFRVDIGPDDPSIPDLPYVDAKDSAGFDATVSPWEDGGSADVTF